MKLQCKNEKCGKTFLYAAKKDITKTIKVPLDGTSSIYTDEFETLETHVCPFCKSGEIDEYVEPQPQIVSVKSVPIEDVDALIKEGYVVLEVYAKTANLVKRAEKPCLRERNESNDKDSAMLREELAGFLKED